MVKHEVKEKVRTKMKMQVYLPLVLTATIGLCAVPQIGLAAPYDLGAVSGIEAFGGSAEAREILARNGFVVADPAFKQIFQAYIESPPIKKAPEKHPWDRSLPSFITTDSAWHTYHVLLEEGVKQMEEIQTQRLVNFSRRLWSVAMGQRTGAEPNDLALYASVGLGLQDEHHRESLGPEEKRIVEGLRTGAAPVAMHIGFPLLPIQFRAQSFYSQSPELSDYFAARQWYASVVFRLTNARETKSAIALARLVNADAELLSMWKALSDPFDSFLAPAEDGTIREYAKAAISVLGTNTPDGPLLERQIAKIQQMLDSQLPSPRVNDQLLFASQNGEISKQTKGFRLLPSRRLPCAVCFQDTVEPIIPNRSYPSGLDFLAASPVLRSPAAMRALEGQFGKSVAELIMKVDCGPMRNSLHGEAMHLLAALQKPLPARSPAPMRTEAWSDLQLWTQLGAWAEQRHTWALHAKFTGAVVGAISPPKGVVAPYPEFFSGLATLARRTAAAFQAAGLEERFDVKSVADSLLELLGQRQGTALRYDQKGFANQSSMHALFDQFEERYFQEHRAEMEKTDWFAASQSFAKQMEVMARRCAAGGEATKAETDTLRLFFECRLDIVGLLQEFAPVCDRLAELAKKSLMGQALTETDADWIQGYGVTLSKFHFYYGNTYESPRDNFPIVSRVFSNPLSGGLLYAGLARPQAIYIILPDGNSNQLYRGAVMTYREFVRPNDAPLDDESWRELVRKGQTPPPPPFTRSFCAETNLSNPK